MKAPCVSCDSMFKLDDRLVRSTGSLVRCSNCNFIFMVHRPSFAEEPIAQDTKIDQSILDDLYSARRETKAELAVDKIPDDPDDFEVPSLISVQDFDEEASEESYSDVEDTENNGLPDISEYEDIIDWENNTDPEDPSSAMR